MAVFFEQRKPPNTVELVTFGRILPSFPENHTVHFGESLDAPMKSLWPLTVQALGSRGGVSARRAVAEPHILR